MTTEETGKPLAGKVAIVTGAGRARGMGRAIALELAALGADVVVTDLARDRQELRIKTVGIGDSTEELGETEKLVQKHGVRSLAMPLDVTDPDDVSGCVRKTVEEFGRLDVLCNNAGTAVGVGPFLEIPDRSWDLSWQVNVKGMVDLCRAAIPHMREAGGGAIVNTASTAGLGAMGGYAGYCATKFAVVGLTKVLAIEFGPEGIRTNAVAPGFIFTDMGEAELKNLAEENGMSEEEMTQYVLGEIPLRRLGDPEDVARTVSWLASPASAYVNGAVVPVAGGQAPGL
jgi:3-oxoacyl-[acyl-carrier protein] reductase